MTNIRIRIVGNTAYIAGHRKGDSGDWNKIAPIPYTVETKGDTLVFEYDDQVVPWGDIFEIDMSDPDSPSARYWWRQDWYDNAVDPSASGVLKRE